MLKTRLVRIFRENTYTLPLKRFGFNLEGTLIAEELSLVSLMRNISSDKFGGLFVVNKTIIILFKCIECKHLLT